MDAILPVISRILTEYGEDIFKNPARTNAMLMDLAPGQVRERLLVRNFIEAEGFSALREAENYPLAERRMLQQLTEVFSLEKSAALWVIRLFGAALGLPEAGEWADGVPVGVTAFSLPYLHGQVAMGKAHVAAVMADGTVVAGGTDDAFQCNVSTWRDVVAVAAGEAHTLGLRADGTVYACGSNAYDQCDVVGINGVSGVYAFRHDSVFVLADGTARAVGRSKWDVSAFEDIISVTPHPEGVIGLKSDGTLALAMHAADEDMLREREWLTAQRDVVQVISTFVDGSIILKRDGRIYKSNEADNYFAQWRDVRAIANVTDGFAILCDDATVRILSFDRARPRISTYADRWRDIKALYGGYRRLIGLTHDSQLVVACTNVGWLFQNAVMSIDYVTNWYPVSAYHG